MRVMVAQPPAKVSGVGSVTIATFNIHRGVGIDSTLDLDRTAKTIHETGAELVALQELDRNMARTGRVDQPGRLAEITGLPIEFRATLKRGPGEYGIAVLAAELDSVEWVRLPRLRREEPRGAIVARRGGLWVCAAHLSTHEEARRAQVRALVDAVAGLDGPVVILGDLNAARRELRPLRSARFSFGPRLPTHRGLRWRQIDHILTSPAIRVVRSWTIPSPASDHLPLVAHLRF
jgi:endonuclease/exonuclease/phosphatase family metal-dependent hydrolase